MTDKHPAPGEQPVDLPDDEEENPGIGQSKGLFGRAEGKDPKLIAGDNTVEGDAENDAGRAGGINPDEGRTNE